MRTFQAEDYAVFICMLAVSASIGLFYAIKDRRRNTTRDYLLAGRKMNPIPVAMSLLSSFISAITIIGTPAEVFVNGTMFWWVAVGVVITMTGAAHIFIPVFYNLGATSVFEYAELRFGRPTRIVASIIFLLKMMIYMAVVSYAPSLALNAVTGLPLWGSLVAVCLVCIFYTTLGGMKAVVWADTIQMVVIFAGILTLLIKGSIQLGGFQNAWDIATARDRTTLYDFDPAPRIRHSTWTVVIGAGILWSSVFGTNQAQVQRAMSVRSMNMMRFSIWLNFPGMASVIILCCLVGVVMFAYYADCDPVKFGTVSRNDQVVPLFMMDLLGNQPGLPGLFLSCVFSGTLSTVSSGLNAISAVVLEDFVRPAAEICNIHISTFKATLLSKGFVILFGLLLLAFTYGVSQVGTMVLQLGYSMYGMLSGPLIGMFTLGMLFPWANNWGGLAGLVSSICLMLWIGVGTVVTGTSVNVRPSVSLTGCNLNFSDLTTQSPVSITTGAGALLASTSVYDKFEGVQRLYTVSYMWYCGIGLVTVVVVGIVVSLITGRTDTLKIDPQLICPFFDIFFPCLPEKIRKPLRFGVRHGEIDKGTDGSTRKEKDSSVLMKEQTNNPNSQSVYTLPQGQDNKALTRDTENTHL